MRQPIILLKFVINIKVSRIAHGIPVGGELETVDGTTLTHSFLGRRQID